jgi:small subunit ribosomal protein S17
MIKTKPAKNKKATENQGKTFRGVVVSDKMTQTIIVSLDMKRPHPKYKKIMKKTKKLYADNNLKAKLGDQVLLREIRPMSKLKRFTTLKILS